MSRNGWRDDLCFWSNTGKFGESLVVLAMVSRVVCHSWLCQIALGFNVATYCPLGFFVPRDVESGHAGKEIEVRIWQIVMDPPCHASPVHPLFVLVSKPGYHNASGCPHASIAISPIPNMASVVRFIRGAGVTLFGRGFLLFIAESIYRARSER